MIQQLVVLVKININFSRYNFHFYDINFYYNLKLNFVNLVIIHGKFQ